MVLMINKFLRTKPCRMLTLLKEEKEGNVGVYITELAKESGATYVHTTKLVRELERCGLAKTEKNGKKKIIRLTDDGMKIATIISEIMGCFSQLSPSRPPPHEPPQKA